MPQTKNMTFQAWSATARLEEPACAVGPSWSNHSRSKWEMLGILVYEDDVMPANWMKKPQARAAIDLQLEPTPENRELAKNHGGGLELQPYSEDRFNPVFLRTEEDYNNKELDAHMRRAFSFIQAYKESRKGQRNETAAIIKHHNEY